MTYLVTQMIWCLLLAALIGFIVGWLLSRIGARRRIAEVTDTHRHELSGLTREHNATRADLDKLMKTRRQLDGKLEAAARRTSELEEQLAACEARCAELEQEILGHSETRQSLEAHLLRVRARFDDAEQQVVSLQEVSDRAASLETQLQECGQKQTGLQSQVASLEADLARCQASLTATRSAVAPTPMPVATPVPAAPPARRDDLKKIEGIGPKIESLLNEAGIITWSQLAEAELDFLNGVLRDGGPRFDLHDAGTWPKQARLAADGRFDELASLQEDLKGGRDPER
jgi:predicted flap endonuclease-1-like 5' DNA nuclease